MKEIEKLIEAAREFLPQCGAKQELKDLLKDSKNVFCSHEHGPCAHCFRLCGSIAEIEYMLKRAKVFEGYWYLSDNPESRFNNTLVEFPVLFTTADNIKEERRVRIIVIEEDDNDRK